MPFLILNRMVFPFWARCSLHSKRFCKPIPEAWEWHSPLEILPVPARNPLLSPQYRLRRISALISVKDGMAMQTCSSELSGVPRGQEHAGSMHSGQPPPLLRLKRLKFDVGVLKAGNMESFIRRFLGSEQGVRR